jgi:hypothetical protein
MGAAVFPRNRHCLNCQVGAANWQGTGEAVRFGAGKPRLEGRKWPYYKERKSGCGFSPNCGSSRLKWLNSLYRPALPEGIRAAIVPPLSRQVIGASPSGKAVDFDSTMRRFESSRPSQAVRRFPRLPKRSENRPEIRTFRVFDSVSLLSVQRSLSGNRLKSPALSRNIPVLQRLSAETGLITTAGRCGSRSCGPIVIQTPLLRGLMRGPSQNRAVIDRIA